MNNTIENNLPWYRYSIVWLVIILPMIAVAASITTLYIAHQNAPEISTSAERN
ncbi:MAG: hypothetical protein ACPGVP_16120 [Thiolinea sp.]